MRSPSPCASTCTMCVLWYPGWGEASLSQGMLLLPPPPRGGGVPVGAGSLGVPRLVCSSVGGLFRSDLSQGHNREGLYRYTVLFW